MEAPSPAPILIAEPIEENKFIIDNNDTSINITLQSNNDKFNKVININDDYWKKNKKYYQDSFELFIKTLKNTLIEKIGDLTFEIHKLDEENINVKLKYSSMFFGFTTEIILVKILTEKEELVNQVKYLMKENKELKDKYDYIIDILKKKTTLLTNIDDYIWLEFKDLQYKNYLQYYKLHPKLCFNSGHTKIKNDYSGETFTTEENLKERMLQCNYSACQKMPDDKLYYLNTDSSIDNLQNLKPVPNDFEDEVKVYIKIPKDLKQYIGYGLGSICGTKENDKYFHNKLNNIREKNITKKMIVTYGNYNKKYNLVIPAMYKQEHNSKNKSLQVIMPIEYYCTNCKKIEEYFPLGKGNNKDGWEIYECLGHDC